MAEDQRYLRDVPEPESSPKIDGVNVVGYLTGEMGLGEVARQYTTALQAVGVPVATKTLSHFGNRSGHEFSELESEQDYPVNLICLQPLELIQLYQEVGEKFFGNRRSIGVWGWELNVFPEKWLDALILVDEVWVWTNYVADTLSRISSRPVVTMPIPVTAPDPGDATVDLGVPEGFTFLFVFDFHSVAQRKNPLGLVRAFKRAFEPGEGPQLIVKSINGDAPQWTRYFEELKAAAQDRPDVHVVNRYLSGREKNALMASCDCYVSLHRSEGFGLTPAEAMALGKPVIATGFSGNTDFMNNSNSYLVDYTMTEVGPGNPPYPAEGLWAEPDLDHAAQLMRQVWENQDEARVRGERARRDIETTLSHRAVGEAMQARLEHAAASAAVSTQRERIALKSINANYEKRIETLHQMIEHGPHIEASSKFGRGGQLARRLMLRIIQPFSFYQGKVDEQMVDALQETARAVGIVRHQIRQLRRQQQEQLSKPDAQDSQQLNKLDMRISQELDKLDAKVSQQLSDLDAKLSQLDAKVSRIDTKVSQMGREVSHLDAKTSQMDAKISQMDTKVSQMDTKVSQIIGGMELGSVPLRETHYLGHPFVYPYDNEIGDIIDGGEEWDAVLRPIVSELLPDDEPTICEVGSNIGASLLQMLVAKPRARVVAVEPSGRFLPFLHHNLELAGYYQVEVLPLLLGREHGSRILYNNSTSASVISAEYDGHEPRGRQLAEMTTLDKVFKDRGRVNLIKVDTDGFDFEVLRGAEATIMRDRPALYFELEPHLLSNPAGDLAWLQGLGYRRLVCIRPQGKTEGEVLLHGITEDPEQAVAWARERDLCDVLACPEGSTYEARVERIEFG